MFKPPKDRTRILIFPQESEAAAFESEKWLIKLFGRIDLGTGCLRNLTDGGEGMSGLVYSPESRAKLIGNKNALGHKHSPETRAKISAVQIGREVSPETRAKISAIHKGKKLSPETRAKIGAASKGRQFTLETCAKMSAAIKGKKLSPETRAKISAANIGNVFGGHIRWHVSRGIVSATCNHCQKETKGVANVVA